MTDAPDPSTEPTQARESRSVRARRVAAGAVLVIAFAAVAAGFSVTRTPDLVRPARSFPDAWRPLLRRMPAVERSAASGKVPSIAAYDGPPKTLDEQRRLLLERMQAYFGFPDERLGRIRDIIEKSPILGQGNPLISEHPLTPAECREIRAKAGLEPALDDPVCGERNMVPLFHSAAGETAKTARVCIDQFEFPNIPCDYPVVHVKAREAAELCQAWGKRLCDAHEWEGACAGDLKPPEEEYAFGKERKLMKNLHNNNRTVVWAYGSTKDHGLCATGSKKSKDCAGGGYKKCGSNTYPAGSFPKCVSSFGAYDLHGNAAEHMNLPLQPEELMSRGGSGQTEMKGSWFIFSQMEAHIDDCRWRAPDWHASRVMDQNSHSNYHLGFRCCKDL